MVARRHADRRRAKLDLDRRRRHHDEDEAQAVVAHDRAATRLAAPGEHPLRNAAAQSR